MIKITVNPDKEPKLFAFSKESIVIGDGSPESVDICFPSEGLHQTHVRVYLKDNQFYIINQANDPFVTLNGQPFGKKTLQPLDLLEIHNHVLRFDELSCKKEEAFIDQTHFPDIEELAQEENPSGWFPQNLQNLTLDAVKSNNAPQNEPAPHSVDPRVEEAYQLHSEEPVKRPQKKEYKAPSPPPKRRWKMRFLKITLVTLVLIVIGSLLMIGEVYLRSKNKSEQEEMAAAESLADYSMALIYARVYQPSLQKQNWVDPQFIKNNLIDLLSSAATSCGEIDPQGNFCSTPYFLRFYTNVDFSRFILVAQPMPSLSQWLFPKDSVLIDSNQMVLRETNDLRQLNRLLASPNPLDGEKGEEITKTIQGFNILKLSDLAEKSQKDDFMPPSALKYLSPGAENLVYNAPRYYHLTNAFINKTKAIIAQPYGTHVAALIQNDLDALSKLPQLVFYTETSMQDAIKTRKMLRKLSLQEPFLTAYLSQKFNKTLRTARIVIDSKVEDTSHENELAEQPFFKPKTSQIVVEKGDPIAQFIREKAGEAKQILIPILRGLNTLLADAEERDSVYISPLFYQMVENYNEQKNKIAQSIQKQIKNNASTEKLLREAGLWDLYQQYLSDQAKPQKKPSVSDRWNALKKVDGFHLWKNPATD